MVGLIETCSGWNMMEGIKSWIKECYLSRREFLSCMNVIFFLGNEVNQPCFFEPFTKINVRIKDKLNMFSSFMSREILGTHFFFSCSSLNKKDATVWIGSIQHDSYKLEISCSWLAKVLNLINSKAEEKVLFNDHVSASFVM